MGKLIGYAFLVFIIIYLISLVIAIIATYFLILLQSLPILILIFLFILLSYMIYYFIIKLHFRKYNYIDFIKVYIENNKLKWIIDKDKIKNQSKISKASFILILDILILFIVFITNESYIKNIIYQNFKGSVIESKSDVKLMLVVVAITVLFLIMKFFNKPKKYIYNSIINNINNNMKYIDNYLINNLVTLQNEINQTGVITVSIVEYFSNKIEKEIKTNNYNLFSSKSEFNKFIIKTRAEANDLYRKTKELCDIYNKADNLLNEVNTIIYKQKIKLSLEQRLNNITNEINKFDIKKYIQNNEWEECEKRIQDYIKDLKKLKRIAENYDKYKDKEEYKNYKSSINNNSKYMDKKLACQILAIPEASGKKEIKKAYRHLVKLWHPDHNIGDIEKFKKIKQAYDFLMKNY